MEAVFGDLGKGSRRTKFGLLWFCPGGRVLCRPGVSACLCFRSLCLWLCASSSGALLMTLHPAFLLCWAQLRGQGGLGVTRRGVPAFSRDTPTATSSIPPSSEVARGGRPGVTSTLYPSHSLVLSPAITGEGCRGRRRAWGQWLGTGGAVGLTSSSCSSRLLCQSGMRRRMARPLLSQAASIGLLIPW